MKKVLSIGSGNQTPREGLVKLDISADTNPDIVWNLNDGPYPIEDNSFDEIECYDVIEHVENIPHVMQECHRILKPDGLFRITTPHFSCDNSYIDPTHRFHLSYFSFDCFSDLHEYSYYSKARFQIINRSIMFEGNYLMKKLLSFIGNRYPKAYEKKWAWLFPAWFLYFELKVKKGI